MLTGPRIKVQPILLGLLTASLLAPMPSAIEAAEANPAQGLSIERLFAAPDLSGSSLRSPRFSPDGRLVAFLQGKETDKDRLDIWAYDLRRNQRFLLVDSNDLAADEGTLSPEEEARRERARTAALRGIVDYEFSPDSRQILIPLAGDLYLYSLAAGAAQADASVKPRARVRQLTQTDAAETDARFSPQGRFVSFVREQNLYLIDLQTGTEHAVTREGGGTLSFGMAEFIAQEEMDRSTGYWWSPDEKSIAYTRVDESGVDELERFEIFADSVQVVKQRYPAAGRPNAAVTLYLSQIDAVTRSGASGLPQGQELSAGASQDGYLARVDWFPDARHLAVQWQSRDQKYLVLRRVDTLDGSARDLIEERSDSWVELHDELTFLKDGRFIWASSRSGYKHLYLYDFEGGLLRPITAGSWMVVGDSRERAIEAVDERSGWVYFTANRATPIERHLYAASLEGGTGTDAAAIERGIRQLSTEAGWHSVTMSKDGRSWLDQFSTPTQPPSLTLRDTRSRRSVELVPNTLDHSHPYAPFTAAHVSSEFGTLQAADGQLMHYELLKPANFDPTRRYPVIVDVYGGPGAQRVRRAWGGAPAGLFRQILAQRGFIVFTLDNRGSGFRGRQFESALYLRMGSIEVEDQVLGVQFLRSQSWVDAERIGVFGWSYGGYMSLMSMVRAPEFFAVGVAGAPVTDWRLYDTHYTERYMGTPESNPQGYSEGMVMTHAPALAGPLLIMHGMADDNVLFSHATALFKQLQDLGKPFSAMPYPGSKHGLLRFSDTGPHAYTTILDFFEDKLKSMPASPEAKP